MPNNPLMKRAGVADDAERARRYLDAAVSYDGPGTSPARRDAFIRTGPKMVEFLERCGMKFKYADGWSDYYDDLPGGQPRGRSLVAELFDVHELGADKSRLSMYPGLYASVISDSKNPGAIALTRMPLRELHCCARSRVRPMTAALLAL